MRWRPFSRRNVRVAAAAECVPYVLPFACNARYQHVTGIRVGLTVAPMEVTVPKLQQGELDVVITDREPACDGSFIREVLYEKPVLVVSALDHPLPATSAVAKPPIFVMYSSLRALSPAAHRLLEDLKAIALLPAVR